MIDIKILNGPLDTAGCIGRATDAACGGTAMFIGTVRDKTDGRNVVQLEYECYESMALKELAKIAEHAARSWKIDHLVIHHRIGVLHVGDIAVVVAVGAAHRDAAFDACRYTIDTLKKTVPIWKKEIFENGEVWVSAHA
ncbi:molybdenum cofactor biosynthesis protein MoaE [Parapedobacter sp. 2B3]|uniref:molybdenum cofactor biosynthesis protein MoaE n=1 Tax=Parapedobacter sp. 2B3 TaxID=3342381 RepID=UPI0035B5A53A